MALPRLERLPTELVRKVLSHLDKTSLLSFSLVNKRCRSIAITSLFKTVYLHLWDASSLAEQIQQWNAILTQYCAHAQVQEVILVDGSPPIRGALNNPYIRRPGSVSYIDEVAIYQDAQELRTWSEEVESMPIQSAYRGVKDDAAWIPLPDFISQLPGLNLLTCASSNQLSDTVIEMLNQAWPGLRLRMFNTSLVNDSYLPILKVNMAPFLEGVVIKLSPGRSENRGITQLDSVIHNAPYLRELIIWWAVTDDYSTPIREPLVPEHDFDNLSQVESSVNFRRAHLKKLQIRVENGRVNYCLDYWARRIDFSKLQTLKLEGPVRRDCMSWSHIDYGFPSLKTLVLNTWRYHWYEDRFTPKEYQYGLACFIERLRPLTRLRIVGVLSKSTVSTILEQHGSSLCQLWLEMNQWPNERMLDPDMIKQLCKQCTQLEDLKLSMNRLGGNDVEVEMYRNLGSIPTLRRLHLTLDYLAYTVFDVNNTNQHSQSEYIDPRSFSADAHSYEDLRKMLVNHAMDENLARSIFTIMDASRTSMVPLQTLILQPVESWHPEIKNNYNDLFREIGRTYMLNRDSRDTHRHEVTVKELNVVRRLRTAARLRKRLSLSETAIFEQIWPSKEEISRTGLWYDEWYSFPLAGVRAEPMDSDSKSSKLTWIQDSTRLD